MSRFLLRVVLSSSLASLCACSSPEKKEEPVASELKTRTRNDGPPLGNPRDKVDPDELLEDVKTSD